MVTSLRRLHALNAELKIFFVDRGIATLIRPVPEKLSLDTFSSYAGKMAC